MGTASVTYVAFPAVERTHDPFAARGWRAYAVWAALLTPFAVPGGMAQLGFVAFVAFFFAVVASGVAVRFPFALPVMLVGAGTLLSLIGATSLSAAGLAIAQDLYLYLWLVVLLGALSRPGSPEALAKAWVVAAL